MYVRIAEQQLTRSCYSDFSSLRCSAGSASSIARAFDTSLATSPAGIVTIPTPTKSMKNVKILPPIVFHVPGYKHITDEAGVQGPLENASDGTAGILMLKGIQFIAR